MEPLDKQGRPLLRLVPSGAREPVRVVGEVDRAIHLGDLAELVEDGLFVLADAPARVGAGVRASLRLPDGGRCDVAGRVARVVQLAAGDVAGFAVELDVIDESYARFAVQRARAGTADPTHRVTDATVWLG